MTILAVLRILAPLALIVFISVSAYNKGRHDEAESWIEKTLNQVAEVKQENAKAITKLVKENDDIKRTATESAQIINDLSDTNRIIARGMRVERSACSPRTVSIATNTKGSEPDITGNGEFFLWLTEEAKRADRITEQARVSQKYIKTLETLLSNCAMVPT